MPKYKWISLTSSHTSRREILSEKVYQDPLSSYIKVSNPSSTASVVAISKTRQKANFIDPLSVLSSQEEYRIEEDEEILPTSLVKDDWNRIMNPNSDESKIKNGYFKRCRFLISSEFQSYIPEILEEMVPEQTDRSFESRLAILENNKRSKEASNKVKHSTVIQEELTCSQYFKLISYINDKLSYLWREDKKIQSIELIIQVASLLSNDDEENVSFYSIKFYRLTDIIEDIGRKTYSRIISLCPGIKISFKSSDICENAKEVTKNWFAKVFEIKNLLSRLYLEISLLKCYRFLNDSEEYETILNRILGNIEGIADPMVKSYLKCFFLKIVISLSLDAKIVRRLGEQIYPEMHDAPERCLEWSLKASLHGLLSDYDKDEVMFKYFKMVTKKSSHRLLEPLIVNSTPGLLANIFQHIGGVVMELGSVRSIILLANKFLLLNEMPEKKSTLKTFKNIWSGIFKIESEEDIDVLIPPWLLFVDKFFPGLVSDLLKSLYDYGFNKISETTRLNIVKNLSHERNLNKIIEIPIFLSLISSLEDKRVPASRVVLDSLFQTSVVVKFSDITVPMTLCEYLRDSVNALSPPDEVKQISKLIESFVSSVDYGDDWELGLQIFTDIRGRFPEFNCVHSALVHRVNNLNYVSNNRNGISLNAKDFAQAKSAFAYITIPSSGYGEVEKINLYLHSASIAFSGRCLSQGEALLKRVVTEILKIPNTESVAIINSLNYFLSTLFNYIHDISNNFVDEIKIELLSRKWETIIPMKISFMKFYISCSRYTEINMDEEASKELNDILDLLSDSEDLTKEAFECFQIITFWADLDSSPKLASLALKLWKLCLKSKSLKDQRTDLIINIRIPSPKYKNLSTLIEKIKQEPMK